LEWAANKAKTIKTKDLLDIEARTPQEPVEISKEN